MKSCCRHPLATLLERRGFVKYAHTIDRIASDHESLDYRAREDNIRQIVLDTINVSPSTADVLVKFIMQTLESGVRYHREWPAAIKIIMRNLVDETELKDPVPRVLSEVVKLRHQWKKFQDIAYGTEEPIGTP